MISIAHKIELKPNNKQKTYFRKAFGCARLAYNWGLAEWQRRYKAGEKCSFFEINKAFNAIKGEKYPFVYEVSKGACEWSLKNLFNAYQKFFRDLGENKNSYPKFKRKRDNQGCFCFSKVKLSDYNTNSKAFKGMKHNERLKRQYLKVPNLGCVKMTQRIRFDGKINNVVISQEGNKYFASFSIQITEEEYRRTHPYIKKVRKDSSVGIDVGIKSALMLSNGVAIDSPKPLKKNQRIIKRLNRQLSKRVHAKTKQERLSGAKKSNNYRKLSVKLANAQRRVANIRRDFTQKVTTILTTHYSRIALEVLNVAGMVHNHRLAQSVSDVSFYELRRQIEYKAAYNGVSVTKANQFYPSSKTCSVCGNVKHDLKLKDRTYRCDKCGAVMDRDYNASLNLLSLLPNTKIGRRASEFTPADLTALLSRFNRNGIATSKVETGIHYRTNNLINV